MKYYIITVKSRHGTACEYVSYHYDDIIVEMNELLLSLAEQHIIESYDIKRVSKQDWEDDYRANWGIFS